MIELFDNRAAFMLVAFTFVFGEMLWRRISKTSYDYRAFGGTLGIYVGQIASSFLNSIVIIFAWSTAYKLSPFSWDMGSWQAWLVGFLVIEFLYYWEHRLSHTVRWLWATHAVHHSPNEFVLPAAFRLGWTGLLSGSYLFFVPAALMGFPPIMIAVLLVGGLRFQFFLHTEHVPRLGPLEWIFNTPSNHRVHHSSRPEYLDKNFGNVLMIFDHIFGSYAAEKPGIDLKYGLTDPIHSHNPFVIAFREWGRLITDLKTTRTLGQGFRAAFGKPGSDFRSDIQPSKPALNSSQEIVK